MEEETSSFYLGNKMLKIIPRIATFFACAVAALSVIFKISDRLYDAFPMAAVTVLLFLLSGYYFKHEKNGMKAALSAVLTVLTAWEFYYLANWICNLFFSDAPTPAYSNRFSFVLRVVFCLLYLSVLVCHFLLTGEHKSNPGRVKRNTYTIMLIVVVFMIDLVTDFSALSEATPGQQWWGVSLSTICMKIFEVLALAEVVGIEILLDMFRSKREQKAKETE